jgi:hypothetical protein
MFQEPTTIESFLYEIESFFGELNIAMRFNSFYWRTGSKKIAAFDKMWFRFGCAKES